MSQAELLVEQSLEGADNVLEAVTTLRLGMSLAAMAAVFARKRTKHMQRKGFRVQPDARLIDRSHATLNSHTHLMRGLKKEPTGPPIHGQCINLRVAVDQWEESSCHCLG